MIAAVVAVLVLIAAGAFFLSQRSGTQAPVAVAPATNPAVGTDSAALVAPPPGALPNSATVAAVVPPAVSAIDSQRVADSVKKAKAAAAKLAAAKSDSLRKADSAKRAAAAKTDTARKVVNDPTKIRARSTAANGLLASAAARKAFADGATHKGGLLGSKTKGDLQTQIDALQPFLQGAGLTYEQFKNAVKSSGFELFDQYGRMVLEELQRFASSH